MKKFILWNYERGTWQYDIFCLLIVAFIFLTPNSWFDTGGLRTTPRNEARVQVQDFSDDSQINEKSRVRAEDAEGDR